MEPESVAKIKEWDRMQASKKLLIRSGAMKAYQEDKIEDFVRENVERISSEILTVGKMSKAEVGMMIGRLESAKVELAAIAQGLQIAYADEKEPEFEAKHKEREREKRIARAKTPEESVKALGIDIRALMLAMGTKKAMGELKLNTAIASGKIKCDKCSAEFWPAMKDMHTCQQ